MAQIYFQYVRTPSFYDNYVFLCNSGGKTRNSKSLSDKICNRVAHKAPNYENQSSLDQIMYLTNKIGSRWVTFYRHSRILQQTIEKTGFNMYYFNYINHLIKNKYSYSYLHLNKRLYVQFSRFIFVT